MDRRTPTARSLICMKKRLKSQIPLKNKTTRSNFESLDPLDPVTASKRTSDRVYSFRHTTRVGVSKTLCKCAVGRIVSFPFNWTRP
jgi:hypothetical protein